MELQILDFIQTTFANPFFDWLMPFLSAIGEGGLVWIGIALVMLCFKKYRPYGIMALIAMAFGFLVGEVCIKNIVCRVRPCYENPDVVMLVLKPESYSFPSGHSCSSFAAACMIFRANRYWGAGALVLAGLIAFSRMYVYVHYPTDVLAGILLGIFSAWLTWFVYKKWILKDKKGGSRIEKI